MVDFYTITDIMSLTQINNSLKLKDCREIMI